jgi:hypothetical protein
LNSIAPSLGKIDFELRITTARLTPEVGDFGEATF